MTPKTPACTPTEKNHTIPKDVVVCALSYLMTRYIQSPSPNMARAVIHHIHLLLNHEEKANGPFWRDTLEYLQREWHGILDQEVLQGTGKEVSHAQQIIH